MCIRDSLITVKDRDPARVDNPFLIEELSEERPGILLWMLEGLHRLMANRYQFTISALCIRDRTYTPEGKPQLDRIHLQNGTYFLDERGFVPEKELCLNRLPVDCLLYTSRCV